VFVLQKLSPTLSSLCEEDDQIYYSEDEDDIFHADAVTHAGPVVENFPDPSQLTEVHQDRATLLLSQLASGSLPSQATIELAVAQLMEALSAEEKQLMAQLVQQMAVMNPVLGATSPLALQVEAIRIILTTRGQRALALGMPAIQQMAYQAQLQNLPQNVSPAETAQPTSVMAPTESCPVSVHHNVQPSQSQVSRPRHHHLTDESANRVPVPKRNDSISLDTDSSASSGHVQLRAAPTLAKGRGRGVLSSGHQYDDEMCQRDRPRGRGFRRGKSRNSAAGEANSLPGNGSAAIRQPLRPPVSHTAQSERVHQGDSEGSPAVNNSESWEEEIDEFGSEVFRVKSSFFRPGMR